MAKCLNCKFADLLHAGSVECRRYPPQAYFEPGGRVTNICPRVGQMYWCGEFTRRDASQKPLVDLSRAVNIATTDTVEPAGEDAK